MDQGTQAQIARCEEQLRLAMLRSDVPELDRLLSSQLMFANHVGGLMSKQDDLDAHRSGALTVSAIELSDQRIVACGDVAIVSVRAKISGRFGGRESAVDHRFTRVWRQASGGDWQVVAGHSSIIQQTP